ncbi:hypothetical protein HYPSUDRAFT_915736 [Hypholoma sublateritium FD-334 SS-4]|uniref:Uncharacterized protein n=1 Tax=Hypholoma sublateritium (strain FD-334 SS-4) TaxID=945553 RepID=A0A0D2PEX6_HYPSF|nr:hypothetical protein HYPSUDRAFT_915736 [Hypholoma sublateritium FD-334 SS-4]
MWAGLRASSFNLPLIFPMSHGEYEGSRICLCDIAVQLESRMPGKLKTKISRFYMLPYFWSRMASFLPKTPEPSRGPQPILLSVNVRAQIQGQGKPYQFTSFKYNQDDSMMLPSVNQDISGLW